MMALNWKNKLDYPSLYQLNKQIISEKNSIIDLYNNLISKKIIISKVQNFLLNENKNKTKYFAQNNDNLIKIQNFYQNREYEKALRLIEGI